jgi:serine protease inhibitor
MCKRRCFTYVFTLCVAIALANSSPSLEDNFKRLLGTGFTDQFNINLIKTVLNNPKNAFISPLSVRLCLALLYEGSSGATEKELQNVLGLSKSDIQQQISTVLKYLQDTDILNCRNTQKTKNANYTLNFGTRMYISDKLQPQQPFQSKACDFYQTKIESVNFKKTDAASKIINSWVSDLTNDKITQIVNSEQLSDAVMLITNAIYFKGFWRNKFLRNETHYGGFYVEPDQIQTVSYMSTIDAFYYHDSKELDAKIIKLPYEGNKFSMLIVLPGTKNGFTESNQTFKQC